MQEAKILISKNAFHKMLSHASRHGSPALKERFNVVGACIGKKDPKTKDLIVSEIVPLIHGELINKSRPNINTNQLENVKAQYIKENLSIIGWYHSILEGELKFQGINKDIHVLFQNEEKPSGFCVLFNPFQSESSVPFRIKAFRLNDIKDPDMNQFLEIEVKIEPPNSLEYFKWIKDIMELRESKSLTFIEEFSGVESISKSELQQIPQSSLQETQEKWEQTGPIFSKIEDGFSIFLTSLKQSFEKEFDDWLSNLNEGATKGGRSLMEATNQMKEQISSGIERIEKWGSSQIKENFKEYEEEFEVIREKENNSIEQAKMHLSTWKKSSVNDVEKIITSNSSPLLERLTNMEIKSQGTQQELSSTSEELFNKLNQIKEKIMSTKNEIEATLPKMIKNVEGDLERGRQEINAVYDKITNKYGDLEKKLSIIESSLKSLQELISEIGKL